jgi:hypothetical protein
MITYANYKMQQRQAYFSLLIDCNIIVSCTSKVFDSFVLSCCNRATHLRDFHFAISVEASRRLISHLDFEFIKSISSQHFVT